MAQIPKQPFRAINKTMKVKTHGKIELVKINRQIYIQTATYNRVTEEQEGNIVSTKKELGVRPTVIPSSQEQSGTGTCYHLGQHQRRHWRDSGQTLLFATQCPATRLPVVDVHSFNRF